MQEPKAENIISPAVADELIAAHEGDLALLYLFFARSGSRDLEQAARALCRTMAQIRDAEEKLRLRGLLPEDGPSVHAPAQNTRSPEPLAPAEELPQYTSEEITRRTRGDRKFQSILSDAERLMGRKLSGNDLRVLFGIYDDLALPAEVISELLDYCAAYNAEKYGGRQRLTARFIEKEAYVWRHMEILTLEQAEAYIHAQRERSTARGAVAAALDIRGRAPTATEEKYISAWLDMGFGADAVAVAYDRTVTNTGKRSMPYMDSILKRWHNLGLHSAQEIEEKDDRNGRSRKSAESGASMTLDELDSIFDRI